MNNTLVIAAMIFWFSTHKVTFNFVFRSSIAIDFEHNLRVTLDSHVSNGLVFNIFSPPLIDLFYKYDDLVLKLYNIVINVEKFNVTAQYFINILYYFFFCFPSVKNSLFSK